MNTCLNKQDYLAAYDEFRIADMKNYFPAKNALGYMFYYGLGVEKNLRRANDYFGTIIMTSESVPEQNDNLVNMAALLLEEDKDIRINASRAYSYLNMLAKTGHIGGVHMFGMMNEHGLDSGVRMCSLTIEFFKSVSEKTEDSKFKFDLGQMAYREGKLRTAALLFAELAEEGHEVVA